jgi:HK97 gp10 family phage protein
MSDSITVEGLDDVIDALKALEGPTGLKIVRSSLRPGAKLMQQQAKADAPKRTGKLANSIKVKSGGTRKGVVKVLVVTSENDSLYRGETFYGAFQEFGYNKVPYTLVDGKIRSQPKGTEPLTPVEGRHFLQHAAEQQGQAAVDAFTEEAGKRIEKLVQGHKSEGGE